MTKRIASLTSMFVLALGLVAFTGSALAGNGNGNGNGNGKAAAAATPTASAAEPASQGSGPGNSASAPGQTKKSSAGSAQAKGGGSAAQNGSGTQGVKPTNATAKGATCGPVGGSASSASCPPTGTAATNPQSAGKADASKRYGNGRTAAQIAVQNGASGVTLHGPGNSQPHKAALCPRGHEVDVHALKAKGQQKKCAATTATQATASTKATTSGKVTVTVTPGHAASLSPPAGVKGASPSAQGNAAAGGVLGATDSAGRSTPAGGVLGAIASVGQGTLPFTGFPLWLAVLAAVGLMILGLTLRRQGRATA